MSEPQKRSEIWNYFTSSSSDKAKCGLCSTIYSYKGGTTSNLRKHLNSKHPHIVLNTLSSRSRVSATSSSEQQPTGIEVEGDTLITDTPRNYESMFAIEMNNDTVEEAREKNEHNDLFSESSSDSDNEYSKNCTVPSPSIRKRKRQQLGGIDEDWSTSAALRDYLKARAQAYWNKNKKAKDSISLCFDSIAETVRTFPLPVQITVKNEIHNYVSQQALKLLSGCNQSASQGTSDFILPLVSSESSKLSLNNSVNQNSSLKNFVSYSQVPTFTVNVLRSTDSTTKVSSNTSTVVSNDQCNEPLVSSDVTQDKLICPKIEKD